MCERAFNLARSISHLLCIGGCLPKRLLRVRWNPSWITPTSMAGTGYLNRFWFLPVKYCWEFSVVALDTTLWIIKNETQTDLRWGKNFNKFLFRNSLLYIVVKKLRKSVNICQSYHKNKCVSFFLWLTVYLTKRRTYWMTVWRTFVSMSSFQCVWENLNQIIKTKASLSDAF